MVSDLAVKLLGCTVHQLKLPSTLHQAAASGDPQEADEEQRFITSKSQLLWGIPKGIYPPNATFLPKEIAGLIKALLRDHGG